ncbi:Na+/H+ antiporter NhaA [Fimbriiglobus ruber]|nr:Na+/H+ antiporter NhaA [Fimbriiglobus ruber]
MAHKSQSRRRPPVRPAPIDRIKEPVRRFLAIESASGAVLIGCTLLAMAAANSGAAHAVHAFWETHVRVGVGEYVLDQPLHFWVNDALMTLFFFVVGLEIKRELVGGELSTPQKAALPVVAALGGMLAPAGLYLALHVALGKSDAGARGWGIPMATDIAFVVGVLAVFGPRVPFGLKIFLLSLAIADDIGAILVIAVAYSGSPDGLALLTAAAGFAAIFGMQRLGVRSVGLYVLAGAGIWLAVLKSGVHPTIAGVLLGLITPSSAWVARPTLTDTLTDTLARLSDAKVAHIDGDDVRRVAFAARESVSPLERLERFLHPWIGFAVMPLFALANAAVEVRLEAVKDPIALAIAVALIVGKPVGIVGFSYAAVRMGIAQLPTGVNWKMLAGAGCLGGIGFTMSLFIAGLALPFDLLDAGKIGILIGSAASACIGSLLLVFGLPKSVANPT